MALQCQDDVEKSAFENRMASYAAMKPGNKAPNILFENNSSLYDIKSEQVLVVFWASWCPHCTEEMPKVNEWAKDHPDTKVIAISLDDSKSEYDLAIKQLPNLSHHTDLKKWDGKAATDYFVYGTPTFILLDKDKKILKKASSFEMLTAK
jgi:thiol-disulfide isomerase/thioredoxin